MNINRAARTRVLRGLVVLALLAPALVLTGSVPASAAVVMSGVADASGATGPKWRGITWVAPTSGSTTFSLAWTGQGNLNMDLRTSSGTWLAAATSSTANPETMTYNVVAGTSYRIAVWAVAGVGTYTVSVPDQSPPPPPPVAGGLITQRARVDASGQSAPTVVPTRFTPSVSGSVTVRTAWSGTANLNLSLARVDTGATLDSSNTSANPEVVTATVTAGVEYRANVSAASGAADFVLRLAGNRALPTPPQGAPNVLLIQLDDARSDTLAVMPAVRRWFADAGTSFPNAYVTTPSCCPSRAALMSGQYDHNNGQLSQDSPGFDETRSVQHYLYDAGYLAGHSGKFIHWYDLSRIGRWWDRWNYFKGGYSDVAMNRDGYTHTSSGYSTVITIDRALDHAESFNEFDDARPWFMQVTPIAPHRPATPEAKYASAAVPAYAPDPSVGEADRSDKPAFVRNFNFTLAEATAERTQMLRTLLSVDEQVDRLMTRLQQLGELDNTIAIFTSDNGIFWGEHGLPEKFMPYFRATTVPLLIRWPGHLAAGTTDSRPVANIDLAPTILAAAGVPSPHLMDGRNIMNGFSRTELFTEYWLDPANGGVHQTWASIRTTGYEYNVYYTSTGAVSFREYYDLVADPYELTNLLADGVPSNDPNVTTIHNRLTGYRTCQGSTCP